jgi:hypothetical protein
MVARLSPSENQAAFEFEGQTLPDDARQFLHREGFVVLKDALSAHECSRILRSVGSIVGSLPRNHPDVEFGKMPAGVAPAARIYNLLAHSRVVRVLWLTNARLRSIASLAPGVGRLMDDHGAGVLYLAKSSEEGSRLKGLRWHDDKETLEWGGALTLGLYLDESTEGNGALRVIPGSHLWGSSGVEFPKGTEVHPNEVAVTALPGYATAHVSGLWHCSPPGWDHGRKGLRRVVYLTFVGKSREATAALASASDPAYREKIDIA